MKATITILAAVLTLNTGILFAGNEITSAPVTNENTTVNLISLAPSAPLEATFEYATISVIDLSALAPTILLEADFSDVAPDANTDLTSLAPLTPAVADFEDAIDVTIDISALAPVTPAADFE